MRIKILPWLLIWVLFFGAGAFAQTAQLEVSAVTFSIHPKVGSPSTSSRTGHKIKSVYGDLKNTILLLKDDDEQVCLFTTPLALVNEKAFDYISGKLSALLNIPKEAVIINSSHDHTVPTVDFLLSEMPDQSSPEYLTWELGKEFETEIEKATEKLSKESTPVTVEWGVAEENRITYNRKGYREDGRSYFVREEDRLNIEGKGYHGVIDPDAAVVIFKDVDAKPIAAISFFTGHPVAAYNPEKLISYGQFPQLGSEILSEHLGGAPVAFVQGCAGNINSKHMLTGTIEQARELGEQLGESLILATTRLKPSKRSGIELKQIIVKVPLNELPSEAQLRKDLERIDDFIKRGNDGDENTLECIGMNFPKALSPPYRAKLVDMVRPWYVWALEQHTTFNLNNIPDELPVPMVVARFGDVGFVGLPYEAFVETGLKIKREADLPYVLTCGYTNGAYGYIPDAKGADDMEYMSGNYRYRPGLFKEWMSRKDSVPADLYNAHRYCPPYKAPAGDAFAIDAIDILSGMAR
ncbi:hypothetical protein OKW21_004195 [Catalinimonas alkaloidigena]|uniref:hypothetical protein n=1 Tax=Catalinimonas alkaloidigena TaxID=1075417 RepID=UPI00240601A8|nr:hypothetical protein [Catalinimonas alkaloidigena]MDF9798932.1 hypothetical protein [Catalinimonas alkaloidigena]